MCVSKVSDIFGRNARGRGLPDVHCSVTIKLMQSRKEIRTCRTLKRDFGLLRDYAAQKQ